MGGRINEEKEEEENWRWMINFRASNGAQDFLSIAVWDLDESPSRAEIDVLSRGSLEG